MSRKPRALVAARPRSIRFTDEEWAAIKLQAAAVGLAPGEWVRARALEV